MNVDIEKLESPREGGLGVRASWTTHYLYPGRYTGVVKENGTDAWKWQCVRNRPLDDPKRDDCRRGHQSRREAIACAREHIAEEAKLPALSAARRQHVREAAGRIRIGDPNTTTLCGSCFHGEHACGGDCHCQRPGCGS